MLSRLLPTFTLAKTRLTFILCSTTILASSCMQEREAQQTVQAATPVPHTTSKQDTLAKAKTKQDSATIAAQPVTDTSWIYPGPKPLPGAILPEKRILAFYGNPLSKRMGILGELPPDKMLQKLDEEV